ncbi:MAG: hypothetical protein JSW33_08580, partial [bacterium]
MRFSPFIFGFILQFSFLWAATDQFYHIEKQDPRGLILQFNFPDPILEGNADRGEKVLVSIPGLLHNYREKYPLLPLHSTVLVVPEGKISWQILSVKNQDYPNNLPVIYESSRESNGPVRTDNFSGIYPEQIVVLKDLGIFRDYRLVGLTIFPIQATPGGLVFYQNLRIKIDFQAGIQAVSAVMPLEESQIFQNFALNAQSAFQISPVITSSPTPASPIQQNSSSDQRVKIIVDRKGIYQITGQDLLNNGIVIQDINPQTFRLTNKNNDVALFISGDADLSFEPGDYIEFLGEKNEKTFLQVSPDLYSDPFSDDNVYWLSWGGSPGIRMVEESGAIISTSPSQYNFAQFYPYTFHFERDGHFERFGEGNTGRLTHTHDAWFFDSGIQSIGKRTYPLNLIYPDSSSFTPVKVKAAFAGKSPTSHQAMVWLNQRLVGQVTNNWYGQRTLLLDNYANSSIRTLDLAHGANNLEIQLPSLASNGNSDWVMLNWVDITYDRQYKALNNYLEFSKPSPSVIYYPNINLFQFELSNFTRSDIEIYKKGISKIVNYAIEVEGSGTNTRYKISFQNNIYANNVEYIALASNAKLSPKKILQDLPFDESNPNLTLRDPSNSAEYLIITHEKFYERAKELLEFRQNKGIKALMVKVEDIYDEFNYGIKSPLAIKEFLEYVFYNWDRNHRLKYVVLLGDANYNYKLTGTLREDYVPTFFYQSIDFGAVATDLPYAQVAGKDLLPDLFVGRIPVTTNGEVANIIEKIKEYEDNPVIGPWRNQSLFISGNDRSTPEFPQISYLPRKPAFRTQNQRVIDMLLDKKYSAFKLNTIRNDSLPFDPNFGGTTDLIDYFDNGLSFVNFLGHGGGGIWADVQLMNLQDVDRLNNKGMYPVITSMTCFTGAFDNPGSPGLAQRFLLAPDRGAIGIFASSGLGWLANDYSLLWNVMKNFGDSNNSVGEAITLGKIDYFVNSQYVLSDTIISGSLWGHNSLKYDMIYQYNLMGDPYIYVARPPAEIDIQVDNELPLPGDTIRAMVQAPFTSAQGYFEFSNGKNEMVSRYPILYTGDILELSIPIPVNFERGAGYLRAYLSDNVTDASGVRMIGVNYSLFDSVETVPAQPNAEDSVRITLLAKDNLSLSDVKVIAILPKGIVAGDTIHLQTIQVGPNKYQTVKKVPPTRSLATVYYFVYTTNSQGQQSRMNYSYKVNETRPDPFLYAQSARLVGEEQVKLAVTVGNNGLVEGENIEVKVYQGYDNYRSNNHFAQQFVTVDARDSITCKFAFPFSLDVNTYRIYADLDRNLQTPDFNRENNLDSTQVAVNMYNLTPALGSTYRNIDNDTLVINQVHRLWLAPGGITQPSALGVQLEKLPTLFERERLFPVWLRSSNQAQILNIKQYSE